MPGNSLRFGSASGAAGNDPQAIPLQNGIAADEALAGRGSEADETLAHVEHEMHAVATIPRKKHRLAPRDRDCPAHLERLLVECVIGKLE